MTNKLFIILADGFEEIEALATVDVLRRLNFNIITAGLGGKLIKGSHSILVNTDIDFNEIEEQPKAVILPGGVPGAVNLRDNKNVVHLVKKTYQTGSLIAAICAAPIVLNKAGVLDGKTITSHPSVKESFDNSTTYTNNRVEQDGNIITAKGAGVVFEFAVKIAEYYDQKKGAENLMKTMFIK